MPLIGSMGSGSTRGFGGLRSAFGVLVQYLVIAGGAGSCGSSAAGGSGAGGYRNSVPGETSGGNSSAESPLLMALSTPYLVTVGAGGAGQGSGNLVGINGNNSVFGTIISIGGGGGASSTRDVPGAVGGSGGGSSASGGDGVQVMRWGGAGISGQGNSGGVSYYNIWNNGGAGGGGAGGAGGSTSNRDQGGNGGDGLSSSITDLP